MNRIKLVFPAEEMERQIMEYRQECLNAGESHIHGSGSLQRYENYREYLDRLRYLQTADEGTLVPGDTYAAVAKGRVVGMIQMRRRLNDFLLGYGGHIGYSVRPSERRKGYATEMLALALEKCRLLGIDIVLITCDQNNPASARTILRNGGVLENEVPEENGNIIQRYWITIPAIVPVLEEDFPECLEVIQKSFQTVAAEFGLTERNAPTNGAFMKMDRLSQEYESGNRMYRYLCGGKTVGFCELAKKSEELFELEKLAVLPEYRHRGYGAQLVSFCVEKALSLGAKKLTVGIIEENVRLRGWYEANGFTHTGTKKFENLPFTVGFMERKVW